MTTRAATFSAKIRNLKDYHTRIVNGVAPLPTGVDVANTLKYFSQTLIGVLKDVPVIPSDCFGRRQRDSVGLSMYPNLNYAELYNAVTSIIDTVPSVQNAQQVLGESILNVIGCLIPFVESDVLDTLPYTVATTLATFPSSLHKDIIILLCRNLLPATLGNTLRNDSLTFIAESTPAILMLVFQYVSHAEFHALIIECLMSLKKNIYKDLLCVIAYGPPVTRAPAVHHLFFYFPHLNPMLLDKERIHHKFSGFTFAGWKPVLCQSEGCASPGNVIANKICLSSRSECVDRLHPLYICADCASQLNAEQTKYLLDVLQPIHEISLSCENKNCRSADKRCVCTCFSIECACLNGFRPLSYCAECHEIKHAGRSHIYQTKVPDVWSCDAELQGYLVEAIINLLKLAQPLDDKRAVEMGNDQQQQQQQHSLGEVEDDDDEESVEATNSGDAKLLSRYGVWLLVELAPVKENIPVEILSRLLATLFQWFDSTAYLPDDTVGTVLDKLKSKYIRDWVAKISESYFEVVLSVLLPHPPEYAKVGTCWDALSNRTTQIKEDFNRFICLVPYGIVSYQVWDYVMAFWLEAIHSEVPPGERQQLKVLINKAFDGEMSLVSFDVPSMYHFIMERFETSNSCVQEQSLQWLQILTSLEVCVPVDLLLDTFHTGINSLQRTTPDSTDLAGSGGMRGTEGVDSPGPQGPPGGGGGSEEKGEIDVMTTGERSVSGVKCFILMLDLLLQQVQIQSVLGHEGVNSPTCCQLMSLLRQMVVSTPWNNLDHTCHSSEGLGVEGNIDEQGGDHSQEAVCEPCRLELIWYQLAVRVMKFVSPLEETRISAHELPKFDSLNTSDISTAKLTDDIEEPTAEDVIHLPVHLQLLLALLKIGTMPEPWACLESHMEFDTMLIQHHVTLGTILGAVLPGVQETLDELRSKCNVVFSVPTIKDVGRSSDADILCLKLTALKLLCLHADCLQHAPSIHHQFIKGSLKCLLIPTLWRLLRTNNSQLSSLCVPLLIHSLTQSIGASVFWKIIEDDFSSEDWTIRFFAVEKVALIARLLTSDLIGQHQQIKTTLACAFCHLIGSLNDMKSVVVQRTVFYLETVSAAAMECLCQCLEFQFDVVICDRTMILHKMYLLSVVLKDQKILTWAFFLNRFDTLCIEAQLDLEHSGGDVSQIQDLFSSDHDSELFLRKIERARFALTCSDKIRSVASSLSTRLCYRRTISFPTTRSPIPQDKVPDKSRSDGAMRQTSAGGAPQFRSRGSRAGIGMFANLAIGGHLREFTDEESNFAALLQRAMDLDGVDRHTLYHLVTLLIKFMITCDQDSSPEERVISKDQSTVLKHVNILLGYNQVERSFNVPPYKLRCSVVFNAFILGLSKVLDHNFSLGNIILPVSLALLQYAPSPQRYASDYQPPNYTLWFLDQQTRLSWLSTLLVILYKYQYNTPQAAGIIHTLTRITINTIASQKHQCKKRKESFGPASPFIHRNRDTSNVSVGDLENIIETETPPQSPTIDALPLLITTTATSGGGADGFSSMGGLPLHVIDIDEQDASPAPHSSAHPTTFDLPLTNTYPPPPQHPPRSLDSVVISPSLLTSSTHSGSQSPILRESSAMPATVPHTSSSFFPSRLRRFPASFTETMRSLRGSRAQTAAGSRTHAAGGSSKGLNPKETFEQLCQEQVRRIAEYSEDSFVDVDTKLKEMDLDQDVSSEKYPPTSPLPRPQLASTSAAPLLLTTAPSASIPLAGAPVAIEAKDGCTSGGASSASVFRFGSQNEIHQFDKNEQQQQELQQLQQQMQKQQQKLLQQQEQCQQRPQFIKSSNNEAEKSANMHRPRKMHKGQRAADIRGGEPTPKTEVYDRKGDNAGPTETGSNLNELHVSLVISCDDVHHAGGVTVLDGMRNEDAASRGIVRRVSAGDEKDIGHSADGVVGKRQPELEDDGDESPCTSPVPPVLMNMKPNFRQRRKTGLSTVELAKSMADVADGISAQLSPIPRRSRRMDLADKTQQSQQHRGASAKQRSAASNGSGGSSHSTDSLLIDHCPQCHAVIESYDEDTISLSIVCLATFIHREPSLAAPLLLDMLQCVAKIAGSSPYPWQTELSGVIIPGNSMSVARQFLRCILHQLAPNNILLQLFMADLTEPDCLKTIAAALLDFADLNSYAALQLLLDAVNDMKNTTQEQLMNILKNLSVYIDCIVLDSSSPAWVNILTQFEIFFRRLPTQLQGPCDMNPVLNIIISVLKVPGLTTAKGILEPFSKLLSFTIQNCAFKLQQLLDICSLCGRAFTKERDKLFLSRCAIFELTQAIKFKSYIPDENLLLLVQLICLDSGGTLGPISIVPDLAGYVYNPYSQNLVSTNAAECMKHHLADCVEFIADLHTINKVKNNLKAGGLQNLNEDTLGSHLKAGVAQFVALELTRASSRDNRIINRYLPWLYHPPSAMQQGPREFIDCVGHIRVLSWLLLGSLLHIAVTKGAAVTVCQPLSLETSSYIADHITVIMTGFAEQSKASVLHMSSLFHSFILCQLWTVYCESVAAMNASDTTAYNDAHQTIMDFWGRVTPGILQLLSHSKVLAEMVNLHFLSLLEALQECNSAVLTKLFSMWIPILYSYTNHLPGHMQVRLQMCQNWEPTESATVSDQLDSDTLLKWLKRLQFKLGQIEVQSSAAAQFYTV